MTRAIDIDCPNRASTETVSAFGIGMTYERKVGCGAPAGRYCNGEGTGVDLCQQRINAAARITRDANRARKKAATAKKEP